MKFRTAALTAVVITAAAGVPVATAAPKAPKPVCNLLVDDKGDELPVPDPALDVLSADIASDTRKITGVIRLAGSPAGLDPLAPTGRTYILHFAGGKDTVFLAYLVAPNTSSATYGVYNKTTKIDEGLGEASAKIVGNAIYITAPIGVFSSYGRFKPGAKITDLSVQTGRMIGVFVNADAYAYNTPGADDAASTKVYPAGARSCVKVGG